MLLKLRSRENQLEHMYGHIDACPERGANMLELKLKDAQISPVCDRQAPTHVEACANVLVLEHREALLS